jgi:hypothetical protein
MAARSLTREMFSGMSALAAIPLFVAREFSKFFNMGFHSLLLVWAEDSAKVGFCDFQLQQTRLSH